MEGRYLDRRVSRRELDHVASSALSRIKMFDKNENHAVTVNETTENEYSFLLVHWSSVVVYSTIIAIVIFLIVMWRISKARWLRNYLARKCGCVDDNDNDNNVETSAHPDYPFKDDLPYGLALPKPGVGSTLGAKD